MIRILSGLLIASAALTTSVPAAAQARPQPQNNVRYQGDLIANGTQFVTFDFTTRKPITRALTLGAPAARCVVTGGTCQRLTIETNDSDQSGNQVASLKVDYAGGSGSGFFAVGAFRSFGVSRVLDSETLTGTVTVTELGDDAAAIPASGGNVLRNIVFGIIGVVAAAVALHFFLMWQARRRMMR